MDQAQNPNISDPTLDVSWKLRALGGPPSTAGFEAALRQVIREVGSVEIRDGSLDTSQKSWRVNVTISRPESVAASSDFFDITFSGRLSATNAAHSAASPSGAPSPEFLHKLAHDLRTPLSALQLWIKVISEGDDEVPPSIRDGLEAIRQCAEEQQKLIASLVSRP